ncbi:MAG: 4-hydroxy-tetrahydrodipicolinate synthase [Vicinamibacteria bacterium]|nr:4-hydroxy-tetrahydrodipicolinate synthase [Vicinamibacteria bacterium]
MTRSFAGAGVALITPFTPDGKLDEKALRRLVRRQIDEGIDVLVPCGTTGEAATLDAVEHVRVIETVVEEAKGKVPVLAGAGSNDTRAAIEKTRKAAAAGADGILSVGPYYNKPTSEGYHHHFTAIADASTLPVVYYNVPGRTAGNIDVKTQLRLAEHPNIAGVKEASGNFTQIMEILRDAPSEFEVLSGDDAVTLPLMALGAKGVISVAANQIPKAMHELVGACACGDWAAARRVHYRYLRLISLNFLETNPIPVKTSLALMGLCEESFRLPLTPPADATREALLKELKSLGIVP